MTTADDRLDGRTARRDRNRDAVLDAVIDLFREGHGAPGAAEVAERAGVSLRSVFRYFDDTDALLRAAMDRHFERMEPLFAIDDVGVGPLDARLRRFVDARLRLYDAAAPSLRVAVRLAPAHPRIARRLEIVRVALHGQAEAMFAPELRALGVPHRRAAIAAVDTLFQGEALEHLTHHLSLTRAQVADTLRRAVHALLQGEH